MAKRVIIPDKKEKIVKAPKGEKVDANRPVTSDENENQFDFGGLPQRDIKKNLGCG